MTHDNEYYLNALRTYGQTVLLCQHATRSRALELRKLAKDEDMIVRFRKSADRVIVLERQ